ncbi:MAG: hypothetical protein ACTSQF_05345, partial [Candidatus Heimdallarchaeaceae archaeon]
NMEGAEFEYFNLKVDGEERNYTTHHVSTSNWLWDYYLGDVTSSVDLVSTNVTFAQKENTTITYSFSRNARYILGVVNYFTGTARAWHCNITEEISFRVVGEQPTKHSSAHSIESITGGNMYSWKWVDSEYVPDRVYLEFFPPIPDPWGIITLIFIGVIFVICSPFLIMLGIKLAKHSKKKKASKANQKLE